MSVPLVLVTGASRGLGYATALAAGARGAHVLALARTVGGLEELDDAIRGAGGAATLIPLDLTDDPALERLGAAINERWGALDAWVHCAAHAPPLSPAGHIDAREFDRCLAVNARATQRLVRVLDPLLRAAPSGIAILTDDVREGQAFYGAYAATKAAARAIWTSWASEARHTNLRVALVRPPAMPTALRARFFPGENRARLTPTETVAASLWAALDAGVDPGAILDLA